MNLDISRFLSEDKMSLQLPVPLGSTVHSFHTACGMFCSYDKDCWDKNFPEHTQANGKRCYDLPCWTIDNGISSYQLTTANLISVLIEWGETTFATMEEAIMLRDAKITINRTKMRNLGFKLDNNGRCIIPESKED